MKKRMLWYGPPKCGKSRALATIPRGAKMYLVDVDRQLGTFHQEWKARKHPKANLTVHEVDSTLDTSIDKNAQEMFKRLEAALWCPPEGYDFYAIDCYTTVGLLLTHSIVGVGDRDYNQRNNTDLAGWVTDFFWQFAGAAERYGAWLIIIMHEKWREIKDPLGDPKNWRDKKEILAPEVSSGARITIPGNCEFVFHTEVGRVVKAGRSRSITQFRTRGTPQIMASAVGYDDVLDELEEADCEQILKTCGLPWKAAPTSRRKK